MSTQWIRAFRSAAPNPRQAQLVARPTRFFHATTASRAPDDPPRDNGPRDDGRKPEGETDAKSGRAETEVANENLFGENLTAANGESQGRKRPINGARSRLSRNRKSDLPPVQIPKAFLDIALHRHGEAKTRLKTGSAEEKSGDDASEDTNTNGRQSFLLKRRSGALFDAAAWSSPVVAATIEALYSDGDLGPIIRRMDVLSVSAYWAVLHQIEAYYGDDAPKTLESIPPPKTLHGVAALLGYDANDEDQPFIFGKDFANILVQHIADRGEIPLTKVALYEPYLIEEIVTALRAEFLIRPRENSRLANTCRPATIVNVHDRSGFSVAQDTLQYVAEVLGADVLHLRAHDIAYIVGRYLGQDAIATRGDISLLGYKAAENSGRLKPHPIAEEEKEEAGSFDLPFTLMLSSEKTQKDTKRQTMSMDDLLLTSGTRGKSEEMWEDIKVNAALDELIRSADADAAHQKPLIVHVNDFNALNMDETGAIILTKMRKIVDELWLSGRKVAFVGSCSTKNAPITYQKAMKTLEKSERVIQISRCNLYSEPRIHVTNRSDLSLWEKQDNLRENEENIVRMLWSMTEPSGSPSRQSEGLLGLETYTSSAFDLITHARFAKYWHSVLSNAEIYRTATTMISVNSVGAAELFSKDCFEQAVAQISAIDVARERAVGDGKTSMKTKKDATEMPTGGRKMDPFGENHEERLMSGMVNAKDMRTTFKDIHAPQETIESIKMLTTLSLIRPEAFSYGVLASDRIPGCLLYGPPGTGKTLLAKAVAKESGANMIEISGASINHMYVGESEKNVRALFRLAKKKQPMVIFIDEADALLGARGGLQNGNRRETINQFLREWDGMDKMKAFIMVATNRPFDLDDAVLRRLPRKLLIDLPLQTDRAAILRIHLKDEVLDETVSIEDMAKNTPLYSGSDLKNVCVAAAMAAVKEELEASERHTGPEPYKWAEKRVLSRRHFDKAVKEIGASVSEDMATLTAIRKFDERYGDAKARKKRKGMGFEVIPDAPDSESARVRGGR
ncbi:hypothetical protein F5Y03DRAFT_224105 [Xylaria venustula]|nr:hypothetical protein F5Y03DRAFT_224105 [Xylaria venustula]